MRDDTRASFSAPANAAHPLDGPHLWGPRQVAPGEWALALWAPGSAAVSVHFADGSSALPMQRGADGVHRATCRAEDGARYAFSAGATRFADPASLQQADGVEGWSLLRDLRHLGAARPGWRGRPFDEAVFSEIHIGSFTRDGTFAAAARSPDLRRLAEIGITAIEIMPVGQFPGRRGWGYDSVLPWAPQHSYGPPEDLAALVAAAHDLGLMVFLDVVFNHFGPVGSHLTQVCPEFFQDERNEWGKKIDYTRPEVRAYFIGCAAHWIGAYGLDGLRLDAVHAMDDPSDPPIASELAQAVKAVPWGRRVHLVAEDSSNRVGPYHPATGPFDASWDDDYHHALHVHLTGETFGYYKDFTHHPQADMLLALRDGQALQGQPRPPGLERKGEPSAHLPASAFVNFNLNHDHAGNRPRGERLITLVGSERALMAHAFLLSAPYIPLLFMGEEIGAEHPFPWFGDYTGKVAEKLRQGRADQFKDLPDEGADMIDPFDPATLQLCHPYGDPAPAQAQRWLDVTSRVLALRHGTLLPLFRSGRVRQPEVRATGPTSLTALWGFAAGSLRADVAYAADPAPAGTDAAPEALPLFQLGRTGAPRFRLWRL